MARTVKEIAISDIEIPKSNQKKIDLDTEGGALLLESVKKQGVLHPPLVLAPGESGGKYRLVFGRRRLACAKKLKLEKIRVTVDDSMSEEEAEFAMLAENLCRSEHKNPAEKRKVVRRWWDIHKKALDDAGKTDAGATPRGAANAAYSGKKFNGKDSNGEAAYEEEETGAEEHDEASETDDLPYCAPGAQYGSEETKESGGRESGEDAESGEAIATATDKSFRRKIQEATGCSPRKAAYDAAIAKAFTEDQLTTIESLDLTERVIRQLAEIKDETERNTAINLISTGEDPQYAIDNAKATLDKAKKSGKNAEDDTTDGEWLDQYCGDIRAKLGTNLRNFDTSALLYRKIRNAVRVLKASVSRDVRNARLNKANDAYTVLVTRVLTTKHPMEWQICGLCSGAGHDSKGERCSGCYGDGFKMTYGDSKK